MMEIFFEENLFCRFWEEELLAAASLEIAEKGMARALRQ